MRGVEENRASTGVPKPSWSVLLGNSFFHRAWLWLSQEGRVTPRVLVKKEQIHPVASGLFHLPPTCMNSLLIPNQVWPQAYFTNTCGFSVKFNLSISDSSTLNSFTWCEETAP